MKYRQFTDTAYQFFTLPEKEGYSCFENVVAFKMLNIETRLHTQKKI